MNGICHEALVRPPLTRWQPYPTDVQLVHYCKPWMVGIEEWKSSTAMLGV